MSKAILQISSGLSALQTELWVGAEGKAVGTYTCLCAGTWVSAAPAWERQQWSPGAGVAAPSVLCLAVVNTLSTSKPVLLRCFGSLRCTAWHRGLGAPDVSTSLSEALSPQLLSLHFCTIKY